MSEDYSHEESILRAEEAMRRLQQLMMDQQQAQVEVSHPYGMDGIEDEPEEVEVEVEEDDELEYLDQYEEIEESDEDWMAQQYIEEPTVKKQYYKKLNVGYKPEFIDQLDSFCKENGLVKRQFVKQALLTAMEPIKQIHPATGKKSIWKRMVGG